MECSHLWVMILGFLTLALLNVTFTPPQAATFSKSKYKTEVKFEFQILNIF